MSPTLIASPSFFLLFFMISSTDIDRFCAIDSSVSPLRSVSGRMLAWPAARVSNDPRLDVVHRTERVETLRVLTAVRGVRETPLVRVNAMLLVL